MKNEKMMNNSILYAVIAVVVVFGLGFFGGMKYQQMSVSNARGTRQFQVGGNGVGMGSGAIGIGGNRMGFRPVSGDVISVDASSITVKMTDGSSKIVIVGEKTKINKADAATKEDVIVGTKVAVFGTDNQDGSVTAQSVQINPVMR